MGERIKVVPADIKSLWNAIKNSSIGAIFRHKGYESKRPKFGTLQMGDNVITKNGTIVKAEEVSADVHLGDKVIIYVDVNNEEEVS